MSDGRDLPPLPESTRRLFDGYDEATLRETGGRDFVIERLLAAGDRGDLRWLAQSAGEDEMRRVLHSARGLDRRSHRFWTLVLDGRLDVEPATFETLWPL